MHLKRAQILVFLSPGIGGVGYRNLILNNSASKFHDGKGYYSNVLVGVSSSHLKPLPVFRTKYAILSTSFLRLA